VVLDSLRPLWENDGLMPTRWERAMGPIGVVANLKASSAQPLVFPLPRPPPLAEAEAKGGLLLAFTLSRSAQFTRRTGRRGSGACAEVALPNESRFPFRFSCGGGSTVA
jgi:hypothetical protein